MVFTLVKVWIGVTKEFCEEIAACVSTSLLYLTMSPERYEWEWIWVIKTGKSLLWIWVCTWQNNWSSLLSLDKVAVFIWLAVNYTYWESVTILMDARASDKNWVTVWKFYSSCRIKRSLPQL